MKALSAISASERSEALKARESELASALQRRLQELEAETAAVRRANEADVNAARAEVEATLEARDRAIALDIKRELYPLASKMRDTFGSENRDTVNALAECWRKLSIRTKEETGADIEIMHLGFAMVAPHGNDALLRAAVPDFWGYNPSGVGYPVSAAAAAIESKAPLPVLENALKSLEHAALAAVHAQRHCATPERLAALLARASRSGTIATLQRHKQAAEEASKKRVATEQHARQVEESKQRERDAVEWGGRGRGVLESLVG